MIARPASSVTPTGGARVEEEEKGSVEDILQVFRIFKLARVLKLARHSPGLQVQTGAPLTWTPGTNWCATHLDSKYNLVRHSPRLQVQTGAPLT